MASIILGTCRSLLILVLAGTAYAQSNLPSCSSSVNYHNCFGNYKYSDGRQYIGEWMFNKPNGRGVMTSSNGQKISGLFISGNLVDGESQTATNHNYEKSNLSDCPTSGRYHKCFGSYIYSDGNQYVGEWMFDKPNGRGAITYSNGQRINGIFSSGQLVGSESQAIAAQSTAAQTQSASNSSSETDNLRREANALRLRQSELEEQQRALAQQAIKRERELEDQLRIAKQQQSTPAQLPASNIPAFIGKRLALVVGNANYRVRPLMNSRNDADDVSRALKGSGFEVIDVRDGSLSQMRTAVRQFGDKLLTNDVGLVYYSGHGIEVKGRNYFIPVNADIQREDEIADQGLDVALILEKMNTAQRSVNIMIVDACRDDPFGRSFRSSSRGLATMEAPRGTIIAYATSPGKVASDGDPRERNSPYTKHLLRAMQAPNKPIEQVFKEVRRAVQDETKNQQTPWENTSLSGDFYFKVQR